MASRFDDFWIHSFLRLSSFGVSSFSIRTYRFCHGASVVCWSIGLFAVVQRDNHNQNQYFGYYLIDLWNPHSWIGVTAMTWYGTIFLFGFFGFGLGLIPFEMRPMYIPIHISLGVVTTVESGIAELVGLNNICWTDYSLTTADTNPAENYLKHSKGCRLVNGTAILVLHTLIFTLLASMYRHQWRKTPPYSPRSSSVVIQQFRPSILLPSFQRWRKHFIHISYRIQIELTIKLSSN